jgi:hypothetical protein
MSCPLEAARLGRGSPGGHSRITTTLNSYTDNIQDAERLGDTLVAELLSGDKSGTVALREGPRVRISKLRGAGGASTSFRDHQPHGVPHQFIDASQFACAADICSSAIFF